MGLDALLEKQLDIAKSSRSCTKTLFLSPGQIELILALRAAVSKCVSSLQPTETSRNFPLYFQYRFEWT